MNRTSFILAFFIFCLGRCIIGYAQEEKVLPKIKEADKLYQSGNYVDALNLYNVLLAKDTGKTQLRLMTGLCYLYSKSDYKKALRLLQMCEDEMNKSDFVFDFHFNLARSYHLNNRFDEAITAYEKVLDNANFDETTKAEAKHGIEQCENGKILIKSSVKATIDNLGKTINSSNPDYAAVISADESHLLFTSKRKGTTGDNKTEDGHYFEDIYMSKKENGRWTIPKNIGLPINTVNHEASMGLSVDGEQLIFYRSDKQNRGGDIYSSRLIGEQWSTPTKLSPTINSKNTEYSASLSSDGIVIYFSSDREGGLGGKDLYKSELQTDGVWGEATNLGSTVNTKYDEDSPFIHPDNKTLYFSSSGHNSMGGYDIFKCDRKEESWSEPVNLGYPISTSADDIHFVLTANGKTGYYATSGHKTYGAEDIFSVKMPESNISLTMVRGTVVTKGKKPAKINIKVIDKESNNMVRHIYNPDPESGKYLMIFPPGKNYDMIVEAEGYSPYVFNIHIPNQTYFYQMYQTMYLRTIEILNDTLSQGISIENTFYDLLTDEEKKSMEDKKKEDLNRRDMELLALIEKIIETTDTVAFENLNKSADEIYFETDIEKKNYNPLLHLVEQVIEYTDSLALKNLEQITESGFFEKADSDLILSNTKDTELKPYAVGNDTIYVVIPKKHTERDTLQIVEKHDEIIIKSVQAKIVFFESNSSLVDEKYFADLDKIGELLQDFKRWKVEISGYTDNTGGEKTNLILSMKRTESIKRYFEKKGIEPERIHLNYFGMTNPKASNDSEDGKKLNRRAEITVLQATVKERMK